jgi:hypothetical protein
VFIDGIGFLEGCGSGRDADGRDGVSSSGSLKEDEPSSVTPLDDVLGDAEPGLGFFMRGERNGLLRAGLGLNRFGGCGVFEAFGVAGKSVRFSVEDELGTGDDGFSDIENKNIFEYKLEGASGAAYKLKGRKIKSTITCQG